MTASDHAQRYDSVPYPPVVHSMSHPRVVGAMGTLFGLDPAPPDRCRVLDIGCASGANIIAMAVDHPESRFVGLDISERAIARGQEVVRALGLDNVTLRVADLAADVDYGAFDYVLAHGVFSWIAPPLQARLLEVIARHTGPRGLAYVSYNTYPGWHVVDLVRTLFLRRTDPAAPPLERVAQARGVLDRHVEAALEGSVQRSILAQEKLLLDAMEDAYIYHEHFVDEHHPTYFEDFVARAHAAGLTYVSDARPNTVIPQTLPPNVAASVAGLQDTIAIQQTLDHHMNTRFRWSILCPRGAEPRLTIAPEALAKLHVGLPRDRELTVLVDGAEVRNAEGRRITINDQAVADVLAQLSERAPSSTPMPALVDLAQPDGRALAGTLVGLFFSNVLQLTTSPISAATSVPEKPRVSPLNRLQAARSEPVTSRTFGSRYLDELGKRLVPLLDGSRDLATLAAELGEPPEEIASMLEKLVETSLISA